MNFTYCPQCTRALERKMLYGRERSRCPNCGFIHFREPKFSVGGLVTEGDRVLLIRRAVAPRIGYWAVPSGFVEYDEQPRAALAREIKEETGLDVVVERVIDVFANADATKPGVFMLFDVTPINTEPTPGDDVSEVRWFTKDDMPWSHLAFAHMEEILRGYWNDGH
ncbi:MAG: NUDIX hydrolase [Chloroflexi bacterium]|nr:NUDIX hydrolase [Chloroflexota bacterium]